ncbi:MAG TPA: DUF4369 domain-containing protein, partial [Bacteroidales bacterium]|nr:DUF4369 domain-containing protein [Bacteroidales bacterium]
MKKLLYLLIATLLLASCTNEKKQLKYTVTVSIDTIVDGYAYLQKREGGEWVKVDSAVMAKQEFIFKEGLIDYPEMYYVFIESFKRNIPVFLDNGDIHISFYKDDPDATAITGSAAQAEYDKFTDEMGVYDDQMRAVYQDYRAAKDSGDNETLEALSKKMDEIYEAEQEFIKVFAFENNKNPTAPYIAFRNSYSWTVAELENIVNNF